VVHQESVNEALRVGNETVEQTWRETSEISERIWEIFQGGMAR
jgi:hypothetical protein